jgi:hypothetical protein
MQESGDSYRYYVENIGGKESFFKEYRKNHIGKTILEIYHILHNYVSKQEKEVYFGDIAIKGKNIDTRKIKILELDTQGIHKTTDLQTKTPLLITNPRYIAGKTLKDYEEEI